jgi:hypothetical protein
MEKTYRSKIDWWLGLIIGIAMVAMAVSMTALLINPRQDRLSVVWPALGMVAMLVFIGWILISVDYTITVTDLRVRAAVFRWRIPLERITGVFPTHNPLSSPALSLDRLRVNYTTSRGKPRWVMISPRDQAQFLEHLAASTGLRQEGRRLVRQAA